MINKYSVETFGGYDYSQWGQSTTVSGGMLDYVEMNRQEANGEIVVFQMGENEVWTYKVTPENKEMLFEAKEKFDAVIRDRVRRMFKYRLSLREKIEQQ